MIRINPKLIPKLKPKLAEFEYDSFSWFHDVHYKCPNTPAVISINHGITIDYYVPETQEDWKELSKEHVLGMYFFTPPNTKPFFRLLSLVKCSCPICGAINEQREDIVYCKKCGRGFMV